MKTAPHRPVGLSKGLGMLGRFLGVGQPARCSELTGVRRTRSRRLSQFEQLEQRTLLTIVPGFDYHLVSADWFGAVAEAPAPAGAVEVGESLDAFGAATSAATACSRWIVRFLPEALSNVQTPAETAALLSGAVSFRVVRGLGLPGQVLIESAAAIADAEAALRQNRFLVYFERDAILRSQELQNIPNDEHFAKQMGLNNEAVSPPNDSDIDAPEAWTISTGSRAIVVGVVDSGIDYTHPDLYLNIWINPGEIPAGVQDADGDGLITFRDLNEPLNAAFVADHNGNTYIDAQDLLGDARWNSLILEWVTSVSSSNSASSWVIRSRCFIPESVTLVRFSDNRSS